MIFGNLNNIGVAATYPAPIRKALEYLASKDFINMPVGSYEIDGKDMYAQVMDAKTDLPENKRPEIHRTYVDLQFSPVGNEKIGIVIDSGKNVVDEELYAEKDILFYKGITGETFLKMDPGSFAVFFPWDIHRPACAVAEPATIRKVVVKIKLSLFV